MRITVTGATGSVGAPLTAVLAARGHEVRALSRRAPEFPVDLTTGEGLEAALEGCDAVIDASNAGPKPDAARAVLVEGGRRLLEAADRAGVGHHVCISIVGIEQVPMPYYRVKVEQEQLVESGGIPYSIVRATQFHSLIAMFFAGSARYRVLPGVRAKLQTVDPAEVATAVADVAEGAPLNGRRSVAGPQVQELRDLAADYKRATGKGALTLKLPMPGKLGSAVRAGALTDESADVLGTVTFAEWLERARE